MTSAIEALEPLRETIRRYDLTARKSLGQNFLLDLNLTRRIARAAGDLSSGTTIEIGPGPGGLTRALLLEGATNVVAVERDPRAVAALSELVEASAGRLHIVDSRQTLFPPKHGHDLENTGRHRATGQRGAQGLGKLAEFDVRRLGMGAYAGFDRVFIP